MCVVLEPPPLRDTPARGRPARARHPPLVAFPLCYAPAMMAVFAARKSILGIAESDADPAPRLPPRPQLDARLPPELRWISALCSSAYFQPCERHEPAGGKEKEKGELTNFFARDTGETLCPSCVGGRDVVQVRLRFRRDFAGGHAENPSAKATTPSRARTPALARAAARSASPMDAVFSRIVAQNTRFGRFPFFASASSLAFRVVRARKGFVPRAGIHAMRRARVAGGAPARRGVAGHTPTPACAFARGPWARMRRTRGSTDRTHSAFASAITATRSRPRERVGFSNDGLVTVSESDSTTPRRRNERLFIDFVFSVFGGARRETASDAFRPRLSLLNRSYVRVLHDRSAARPTTTSCACATCARCSTRARSRRTSSTALASRFSTRARRRAGKTGKTAPGTSAMKKRR